MGMAIEKNKVIDLQEEGCQQEEKERCWLGLMRLKRHFVPGASQYHGSRFGARVASRLRERRRPKLARESFMTFGPFNIHQHISLPVQSHSWLRIRSNEHPGKLIIAVAQSISFLSPFAHRFDEVVILRITRGDDLEKFSTMRALEVCELANYY